MLTFKLKKKRFKADAVITNKKNLPIGILTADCVPILIYDDTSKNIAAIHAGWKGAYKGIIHKVINLSFAFLFYRVVHFGRGCDGLGGGVYH